MLLEKKILEKIKLKKQKINKIFFKQNFNFNELINKENDKIIEFMNKKNFNFLDNNQKENFIIKLNECFDKYESLKNYDNCYKIIKFLFEIINYLNFFNLKIFIKNLIRFLFLFGIDSFNLSQFKYFFNKYKEIFLNMIINENILNDFLKEICKIDSVEIYEFLYSILKNSSFMNNINYEIVFNFLNVNNFNFPINYYLKLVKLLLKKEYLIEKFNLNENILKRISYLFNNFNCYNFNKDLLLFIILQLNKNLIFIDLNYNILYDNIEIDFKLIILEIIALQIKFKKNLNMIINKEKFLDFVLNFNLLNMVIGNNLFLLLISIINTILSNLDNEYNILIFDKENFFKKIFSFCNKNDNNLNNLLNDLNIIWNSKKNIN